MKEQLVVGDRLAEGAMHVGVDDAGHDPCARCVDPIQPIEVRGPLIGRVADYLDLSIGDQN
jgi:hypothetical protein